MPNDGDAHEDVLPDEQASTDSEPQSKNSPPPDEPDAPRADTPQAAGATDATSGGPESTVAELERELADLKDQLLRKSADFDNYRKRMQREKEEFASYANRELLQDIVPIIDDFERAIRSSEESNDFTSFHDGIVMIERQFTSMLERKWRLIRFDSVGEEFDPQRHEAMMTEEAPGAEHPVVLEDFQKGYLLNERVLRPAKVKVAMPVAGSADVPQAGSTSEESGQSDSAEADGTAPAAGEETDSRK